FFKRDLALFKLLSKARRDVILDNIVVKNDIGVAFLELGERFSTQLNFRFSCSGGLNLRVFFFKLATSFVFQLIQFYTPCVRIRMLESLKLFLLRARQVSNSCLFPTSKRLFIFRLELLKTLLVLGKGRLCIT